MVSNKIFLQEQKSEGLKGFFTPPVFRHLILSSVDQSARAVYGNLYPTKCLQTADAIRVLMAEEGMHASLMAGAVCFAKIGLDRKHCGWTGFWGEDHHVWLHTQSQELVDLSISQLNRHPATTVPELPPPALWWAYDQGQLPFFRYLPDVSVSEVKLKGQEARLHERLLVTALKTYASMKDRLLPSEFNFSNLIISVSDVERCAEGGLGYLQAVMEEPQDCFRLPSWIQDRSIALERAIQTGKPSQSPLTGRRDLFWHAETETLIDEHDRTK